VPTLWVVASLLSFLGGSTPLGVLLLPVLLLSIGLTGTIRLSFALHANDQPALSFGEALASSWGFLGRFFCLDLLGGLVAAPVLVAALAGFGARTVGAVVVTSLVVLVIDVVGTFVPPALALSTSQVTKAIPLGWRVLREGWPQHRWHVLLPPVTLQVVAAANLRALPLALLAAIQLVVAIVGVVVRGAVTAAWLRAMPASPQGPSWLDGRPASAEVGR